MYSQLGEQVQLLSLKVLNHTSIDSINSQPIVIVHIFKYIESSSIQVWKFTDIKRNAYKISQTLEVQFETEEKKKKSHFGHGSYLVKEEFERKKEKFQDLTNIATIKHVILKIVTERA